MGRLLRAIGFGLRSAWHRPAYAIVSSLLLGASAAALFAVIAVLDALIVRPPTARAPEELVFVRDVPNAGLTSLPMYSGLRKQNNSFVDLFAYEVPSPVAVRWGSTLLEGVCQGVSNNFFSALGVDPVTGRGFAAADERAGAEPVALLSNSFAQRLGAQVGQQIELDAHPFRVVGVLPEGYVSVERRQRPGLWIPLAQVTAYRVPWLLTDPGSNWLSVGGRLKPGVTLDAARAEIEALDRRIMSYLLPELTAVTPYSVSRFLPARLAQDGRARLSLLLSAAVAALFALAFANFFALSLLRLLARSREVAVRMALGGTRSDIASWLLGEMFVVLLLGLSIGRLACAALLAALRLDPRVDRLLEGAGVALDTRALGFGLSCSLFAGGVVWVAIVRQIGRGDLLSAIKETSDASRQQRSFLALLAAQMAIALCLVALSFGFLATLRDVAARPLPFDTEHVFYAVADVRKLGWFNDRARSNGFYQAVIERLRRVPGVLDAAASDALPLRPGFRCNIFLGDKDPYLNEAFTRATFSWVSPSYWNTLGFPLLSGRAISVDEALRAEYVAVINRTMARRFWSSEQAALGQTFRPWPSAPQTPVIGVVDDVPTASEEATLPHLYISYTTTTNATLTFVVHVQPRTEELQPLNDALREIWPDDDPPQWHPIRDHVAASRGDLETAARLASWVALLATAVIACGLYFFSAFTARQTLRDSALRMALGARPFDIVRQHLSRYGGGVLAGLLLGGFLVLAARPILERFQVDLRLPDVPYVILAAGFLVVVAFAGLCAPLRGLRQLDIIRTLDPK
jgi:putative ABC transport system permease protein